MAIANVNNDLGEYWEFFRHRLRAGRSVERGVKFGVNYFIYAMTH